MLLLCCSKNPFDCFFPQFINLFVSKSMTDIFCHFHILFPNMTHDHLHMVFTFRTFMDTWTLGTHFWAALVFSVSIPVRGAIR